MHLLTVRLLNDFDGFFCQIPKSFTVLLLRDAFLLYNKASLCKGRFYCGVLSGNFHLTVEFVKYGGRKDSCSKKEDVDESTAAGYGEALKRNDHNGRCYDDSDNGMKGKGIESIKQKINSPGEADDGDQAADSGRDQNLHGQMAYAVHKRSVQSKWHQQSRKAHAGSDYA